jgi:hypothetical protein
VKRHTIFFAAFAIFASFAVPSLVSGAAAQTKPAQAPAPRGPSVPRIDLSVGTGFISSSGLGDANADLRGRSGATLQLFATSSRLGGSLPVEVRLGYRIGPRYTLEMRGAWSRPEIRTSIAGDVEGAPALTVAERVDLYSLDLGILVMFNRSQPRALMPFIAAGAGYAGAVHEGLTLLENGFTYRGGGGIKYPLALRNRARIKAVGVRADGTLIFMSGGLANGFGMTHQVAGSGSLYLTF